MKNNIYLYFHKKIVGFSDEIAQSCLDKPAGKLNGVA